MADEIVQILERFYERTELLREFMAKNYYKDLTYKIKCYKCYQKWDKILYLHESATITRKAHWKRDILS